MFLNYAFLAVQVADVVDVVNNLTMFTKVRGSNPSKAELCFFTFIKSNL